MKSKTQGYIFVLLAITIFSLQDGISKHLASAYPPVFITMIRYWAFAAFTIALACKMRGGLKQTAKTKRPLLQVFRGVLLASQVVVVINCFALIGLAHSQAIFSATPILIALLSMPILGERVGWRRWTAIGAGLVGVLLILKPEGEFFDVKLLLAVFSCFLFAFYVIATRLVSRDDSAMTSFFYTGVVGGIAMTLVGPFYWTWMSGWDWGWMTLVCLTSISSHYFLIRAYDMLDAAAVQPLTYLQLVYASIIGVVIYSEKLSLTMIVGSAIVVAAGIFTVWREHVVARRGRLQRGSPQF
ncbi:MULTISPECIES: DMT family transporter [unclassified Rhizobium]|jgi:drug/metabolite transporter (DMT)-like permease|uniref:DMT family transporter n=1 Tax=unclassified Rhizobium TaxID=2613769 RepID=UPI00037FF5FA|nr:MULTISPECIES: DMT family transporter [unclassified Rhizobium]MBD9445802.1 DMT family transporter [Rhizobium sp. RHZ01]MBD9454036.1 DMT family transporter [Rhizobium sp. RHZ02]NMN71119.1 drug/metabolite transporter (DMT)-like permease [Rhizobium sp. 57MFTsu3.2]